MEIILHIGTEKTGSTSIQSFLHQNRELVNQYGIYYSNCFGQKNHTFLLDYALGGSCSNKDIIIEESLLEDFLEAKKKSSLRYILSCELLSSRIHTNEELNRLSMLLGLIGKKINTVVYVRSQVDMHIGHSSTKIFGGKFIDPKLFWLDFVENNFYYNHLLRHNLWCSNNFFNLDYRAYSKSDTRHDFLTRIGFPSVQVNFDFLNPTASAETLAIINAINYCKRGNFSFRPVLKTISASADRAKKFKLPYSLKLTKQRIFLNSNRKFCDLVGAITLEDLVPVESNDSADSLQTLSSALSFGDDLYQIIDSYVIEYQYYRLKYFFLELQVAFQSSRIHDVRLFNSECVKICSEIFDYGTNDTVLNELVSLYKEWAMGLDLADSS